jgi:hypothetical protein
MYPHRSDFTAESPESAWFSLTGESGNRFNTSFPTTPLIVHLRAPNVLYRLQNRFDPEANRGGAVLADAFASWSPFVLDQLSAVVEEAGAPADVVAAIANDESTHQISRRTMQFALWYALGLDRTPSGEPRASLDDLTLPADVLLPRLGRAVSNLIPPSDLLDSVPFRASWSAHHVLRGRIRLSALPQRFFGIGTRS